MKISMKRRKIGYTYGSVSGRYPFRGEKTVEYESQLEADLLKLLEFSEAVIDVEEQPFTLLYRDASGAERRYTPDFLVRFRTYGTGLGHSRDGDRVIPRPRPMVIEVKPREILRKNWKALRPKFRAAIRHAAENDMAFRIYDESRIRGPELDNIEKIRRYRRYDYPAIEEERILGMVETMGHCPIDVLLASLYTTPEEKAVGLGHVYHLLDAKKLACDITLPLTRASVVWVRPEHSIREEGI